MLDWPRGSSSLDAIPNDVDERMRLEGRVQPGGDATKLPVERLVAVRQRQAPGLVVDEDGRLLLAEQHGAAERVRVLLDVPAIRVLEVNLARGEAARGGKAQDLHQR